MAHESPLSHQQLVWLYTDGACSGNPGPGAWALVGCAHFDTGLRVFEKSGFVDSTTNNRMEMMAVIEALKFLELGHADKEILLMSDSNYVVQGLQSWLPGWKKRHWKKADGKAVLNQDLWQQMDALAEKFQKLKLKHLPGHARILGNEHADQLAVQAIEKRSGHSNSMLLEQSGLEKAFAELPNR